MIRSQRSVITVLIVLYLFFLPLIFSCAGPESEKPAESPSYIGFWDIQEDWKGCGKEDMKDYTVEITQSGNKFNLTEIKKDFIFECNLNVDNELLCGGDVVNKNGDKYSFSAKGYILRFSGDDGLVGECDWTYYPHDGDVCNGHSVLTAIRTDDNETSGN